MVLSFRSAKRVNYFNSSSVVLKLKKVVTSIAFFVMWSNIIFAVTNTVYQTVRTRIETRVPSLVPIKQRRFTLLELLAVMAFIGLLSAFVAPKVFGQIGKSETKIARV